MTFSFWSVQTDSESTSESTLTTEDVSSASSHPPPHSRDSVVVTGEVVTPTATPPTIHSSADVGLEISSEKSNKSIQPPSDTLDSTKDAMEESPW